MRLRIFITLFLASILLSESALAAGVGFAPVTGLWLSKDNLAAKELVRIYAVVVNNDYYALDGAVGFYDNGALIDTATFKTLPREAAKELRVFWQPIEGKHTLSARFTEAIAVDEHGARQTISLTDINAEAGMPFSVGGGMSSQDSLLNLGSALLQRIFGGGNTSTEQGLAVTVARNGDRVEIKGPGNASTLAHEIDHTSSGVSQSTQVVVSSTGLANDLFAKNREVLNNAKAALATVTSSAAQAETVYKQTASLIDRGKDWYAEGQTQWTKVEPYVVKLKPWWNTISDNNNPRRILIIVAIVIIVWFILRKLRRLFFVWMIFHHTRGPKK